MWDWVAGWATLIVSRAGSVTAQMINFIGLQTVKEQLKSLTAKDVLIAPALGDISASSFDRSRDAIRIGAASNIQDAVSAGVAGTRVVFGSNWGIYSPQDYTEAYEVTLPAGWNQ